MKTQFMLQLFLLFSVVPVFAQMGATIHWQDRISLAGTVAVKADNLNLKPTLELYLYSDTRNEVDFHVNANLYGEEGVKLYLPAIERSMTVQGLVKGMTEIIPVLPEEWNGTDIDLISATKEGSSIDAFRMKAIQGSCGGYTASLKHRQENTNLIWYLHSTPVLPLIKQLGSHTLIANNNSATNGGYKFMYYYWYKDGELIKEDTHANHGGSYYTGGVPLDVDAEYMVEAVDIAGNHYFSCPYKFIPIASPLKVSVYPNPAKQYEKVHIRIDTNDIRQLKNAVIDVYSLEGRYMHTMQVNSRPVVHIDLPFAPGVYLLKVKTGEHVCESKIIVN